MVNIEGLDGSAVVAALYNAARPQGMGFLSYTPQPMSAEQGKELVGQYLDYVRGRVMKLKIEGDSFDERLFDRDNGDGSAQMVIDSLRATGDVNNEAIKNIHAGGLLDAAEIVRGMIKTPTTSEGGVINLGMDDVAEPITDALKNIGMD